MAKRFQCPGCGTSYPFHEKLAGKKVKCKKCENVFTASLSPKASAQSGKSPALHNLPSDGSLDDVLGDSLPPVESAVLQSGGRSSFSTPSGTAAARRRKSSSYKMTKWESQALYYGIGMFIGGILLMFGIRLRSRGARIRDRLSGGGHAAADPTLQFIGLLMAIVAVGAVCYALRRRLHIAASAGAGMLILLGVSYLYSPLHRATVVATSRLETPPPASQPPSPFGSAVTGTPGMGAESQPTEPARQADATEPQPADDLAGAIDLLQRIDLNRDAVAGEWTMNQSAAESTGGRSILSFPFKPPRNYRWRVIVERVKGVGGINLVITVGDRQTMVVLEGFREKLASGLNTVSGRTADVNETTWRGRIFSTGTPTTIVCTVEGPNVRVACDGQEIINWSGAETALALDRRYWANVPPERLAVAIYDSSVLWRVSDSTLEAVRDDATTLSGRNRP